MAQFTQSIRNMVIEQADKTGKDITTVQGIYDSALARLFTGEGINAISSQYREQFIVGFTLHFWNYELGLETEAMWKMKLFEKLFNKGAYINDIYAQMDKQLFANYRVHKVDESKDATIDVSRETSDTTNANSSTENSNTNVVDGETSTSGSATETASASQSGTDTDAGTVTNEGNDKSATSENGDNAKSSETAHTGTSASATSGEDTTGTTKSASHSGTSETDGVKVDDYGKIGRAHV